MSQNYYYFVASLPVIGFDSKPPISKEDFLDSCHRLLPLEEAKFISDILAAPFLTKEILLEIMEGYKGQIKATNNVFREGVRFVNNLRNQLTRARAENLGKNISDHVREGSCDDSSVLEIAAQAQAARNPLESQRVIDRAVWNFLENLDCGQHFSLEHIVIYALQLKILYYYAAVQSKRGQEMFKEYQSIGLEYEKLN